MYTSCTPATYKMNQKNLLVVLDFLGILVNQEDPARSKPSQHTYVTIRTILNPDSVGEWLLTLTPFSPGAPGSPTSP